jgi:hypothetical protein
MATTTQQQQAPIGTGGGEGSRAAPEHDGQPTAARLTAEQVWRQLAKASFAVLSYVTPAREPRSSGVLYKTVGRRLYIATAPDSWKARHVAASGPGGGDGAGAPGRCAVARVAHPAGDRQFPRDRGRVPGRLVTGSPAAQGAGVAAAGEWQASAAVIEVIPEGAFVTYGVGVPLARLRDPAAARARVPVTQEGNTR